MSLASLRRAAGALALDVPRYRRALASPRGYLSLCNRGERLEPAPGGDAYRCAWDWASDLSAPVQFPSLGRRMSARAHADHPVVLADERATSAAPALSFIIGHRGTARLPHLLATIASLAGQRDADIECIVVEQDQTPLLPGRLPAWVKHVFTPLPEGGMPYCRSWALNVGAASASGRVLVLHDGDMLLPADYAAEALKQIAAGAQVANIKRFVFYMDEADTSRWFSGRRQLDASAPEAITQNLEAGGSLVIVRDAFFEIGGMDEEFIGWGGEDNEFWERAQVLRRWEFGYLPIWHLWHPAQPKKQDLANETRRRFLELAGVPVADRIARLRALDFGRMDGPVGARVR
jgi:hypothetical protein